MAGPVPPVSSSSSVSFSPTFGSFGDFVSLIALIAYSCRLLSNCYRADSEIEEMQRYLKDVRGVLELMKRQLATHANFAFTSPCVVDIIRQLSICTDIIEHFDVWLSTTHPPKTGWAFIDRTLGNFINAMMWTAWYRREAHDLRKIAQEHIDLVRPLVDMHNFATPAASSTTNHALTTSLPKRTAVVLSRTPSGRPESIVVTLNIPIAELGLSSRQPIVAPRSPLGSRMLGSANIASPHPSSQTLPSGKRGTPSAARVVPPLQTRALPPASARSTPSRSSSADIAEWQAKMTPIEGEGPLACRYGCVNSPLALSLGTHAHRPSLPRLNHLRGSRSNTPSPNTTSPTIRVA